MSSTCRPLLAALLLVASRALAQAGGLVTGSIAGVVLDSATQAPLADAVVTARGPALTGEQPVTTDQAGAFEITLLPVGTYSLAVQRDGYLPFAPDGVNVRAHRTVKVKLALVTVPAAAAPPPAVKAVDFNEATMTPPVIISGSPPEYTQDAIDREVEGLMVVRCVVTALGTVHTCKVLKSLPFMDRAVIASLETRRYKPATQQGKPIDVNYTFNVRLKLPAAQ